MRGAGTTAPTAAGQIRSICARTDGALLAVERTEPVTTPVHHLLPDGSFVIAVPADHEVATHRAGPTRAVLELADYAPVPVREPVRSLVWI